MPGRKPVSGLHQQLGPVRLTCGCLAYYPGVRPRADDIVLCHKHDRWVLADVLYPSSPGCGSQGRDPLDPAFTLHCTQSRGHAGDHHDEVAGQKFPATGRLRSVVEGNTGRRP